MTDVTRIKMTSSLLTGRVSDQGGQTVMYWVQDSKICRMFSNIASQWCHVACYDDHNRNVWYLHAQTVKQDVRD